MPRWVARVGAGRGTSVRCRSFAVPPRVVLGPPGIPASLTRHRRGGRHRQCATVSAGWGRDWPRRGRGRRPEHGRGVRRSRARPVRPPGPGGVPDVSAATVFEGTSARNGNPAVPGSLVSPSVLGGADRLTVGRSCCSPRTHPCRDPRRSRPSARHAGWSRGSRTTSATSARASRSRQAAAELQAEIAAGHVPAAPAHRRSLRCLGRGAGRGVRAVLARRIAHRRACRRRRAGPLLSTGRYRRAGGRATPAR